MEDVRIGLVVRRLRRRLGWRQDDLAARARIAQSTVSLVERGHIDRLTLRTIRRIFDALEARLDLVPRWQGAALDRLLDERHARLAGAVVAVLRSEGWQVAVEATYSQFGERGSIDVLAWHPATRLVLVVEVKSEFVTVEATLRPLDAKARLAPGIARERFGARQVAGVARILVVLGTNTNRRRLRDARSVLDAVFPGRGSRRPALDPPATGRHRWALDRVTQRRGRW
jgi:transcriptional regulator with XRE-family HTH domain